MLSKRLGFLSLELTTALRTTEEEGWELEEVSGEISPGTGRLEERETSCFESSTGFGRMWKDCEGDEEEEEEEEEERCGDEASGLDPSFVCCTGDSLPTNRDPFCRFDDTTGERVLPPEP